MATSAEETAKRLYEESIVIDGLNVRNWDGSSVYQSLHAGKVMAINATIAIWENFRETLDNIAAWLHRLRENEDVLVQVRTVEDIVQAKEDGKVGIILGFQNATPIEVNLDRLAVFHALDVRIIQLTYQERNLLGNG